MTINLLWRNRLAALLLLLGTTQILGDLLEWPLLRGIGAASTAAPYPKVFSDVDGLEAFASRFTLYTVGEDGSWNALSMTPELYSKLAGSYNRRNVYGAALSYGPRLPEKIWRTVYEFGLGEEGPLRTEMQLPPAGDCYIRIETATRGRSDTWILGPEGEGLTALKRYLDPSHTSITPNPSVER